MLHLVSLLQSNTCPLQHRKECYTLQNVKGIKFGMRKWRKIVLCQSHALFNQVEHVPCEDGIIYGSIFFTVFHENLFLFDFFVSTIFGHFNCLACTNRFCVGILWKVFNVLHKVWTYGFYGFPCDQIFILSFIHDQHL